MLFLAMLLLAGIGYGIAAIAKRFNLLSKRRPGAEGPSDRRRPSTRAYEDELPAEGTAWTALDELQLKRLLKDSAS